MSTKQKNSVITTLLNGTLTSLKSVVPVNLEIMKPQLLEKNFRLNYGVFIGITGDIRGKLILASEPATFSSIGTFMFGMPLEGEMLHSFSGELGNMVAGGLSTNIFKNNININITAPTIMNGETTLSGYKEALKIPTKLESGSEMKVFLLMD